MPKATIAQKIHCCNRRIEDIQNWFIANPDQTEYPESFCSFTILDLVLMVGELEEERNAVADAISDEEDCWTLAEWIKEYPPEFREV